MIERGGVPRLAFEAMQAVGIACVAGGSNLSATVRPGFRSSAR
jgi:hypothetical protein